MTTTPGHDGSTPLNLATFDDLVHEMGTRCTSLVVGGIFINRTGNTHSTTIRRMGDQVAALGIAEMLKIVIVDCLKGNMNSETSQDARSTAGPNPFAGQDFLPDSELDDLSKDDPDDEA